MEDAAEADAAKANEELGGEFITNSQIQAWDIEEQNITLRESVIKFCGKKRRCQ